MKNNKTMNKLISLVVVLSLLLSLFSGVTFDFGTSSSAFADVVTVSELTSAGGNLESGTYELSESITLNEANITIPAGETVTIDLKGFDIVGNGVGSVITVYGTLTIQDTSEDADGTISGGVATYGGGVNVQSGSLYFESGSITLNEATNGGGIYGAAGTYVEINGGAIAFNEATYGGGIYTTSNELTINDGEISYNEAGRSGGIYVAGTSSLPGYFYLNGGTISNNTATYHAGGVWVTSNIAEFEMTGGIISENTAATGGGIYFSAPTSAIITGGEIIDNTAIGLSDENIDSYGGGILINSGGTVTINSEESEDVVISGNSAEYGGAISVNGTLNLDGIVEIKDNYDYNVETNLVDTSVQNNIYLYEAILGSLINFQSGFDETNSSIYVEVDSNALIFATAEEDRLDDLASIIEACVMTNNGVKITETSNIVYPDGYAMVYDIDQDEAVAKSNIYFFETFDQAWHHRNFENFNEIILIDNVELTSTYYTYAGDDILLTAEDEVTITFDESNTAGFWIYTYGKLEISGEIIFDGQSGEDNDISNTFRLIHGASNSECVLSGNVVVKNFNSTSDGIIYSNGSITIKDDVNIYNNKAKLSGAIYLLSNAEVYITGGTISDNYSTTYGGAIYNSGKLYITGGKISDNYATTYGGAIYNKGELYIDGGTISSNKSILDGGAICNSTTLEIKNAEISDNTADGNGGAIYNAGTLEITNSKISSNTATNGGAIYSQANTTLNIYTSNIYSNTATYGGAIYSQANTTLNIYTSDIYLNTATYGGAMYIITTTCLIEDSNIYNNYAFTSGIFYVTSSDLSIKGSSFIDNFARSEDELSSRNGGALYVVATDAYLYDCEFTGNYGANIIYFTATSGFAGNTYDIYVKDVDISNNSTTYGIYVYDYYATFDLQLAGKVIVEESIYFNEGGYTISLVDGGLTEGSAIYTTIDGQVTQAEDGTEYYKTSAQYFYDTATTGVQYGYADTVNNYVSMIDPYTVTFNANEGTLGDSTSSMATADGQMLASFPADPTRDSYTFVGWFTETTDGDQVLLDDVYSGATTIYAQWTEDYVVTYITDCDTYIESEIKSAEGTETISYPTTELTKTGYTFVGWFTDSSFDDEYEFKSDAETLTITANTTLYAKWDADTIEGGLTFDETSYESGEVNAIDVTYDTAIGGLPEVSKTGYTFAGWYIGTTEITAETEWTYTATQEATAKWTANTYTIAYNANGGSGEMDSTSATYDKSSTLTANTFTYTGYEFAGWATESMGEVEYADEASVKNLTAEVNGTVNLYAVWDELYTISVTPDSNGTAEADVTSAVAGDSVTITAEADTGYEVDEITVTYGDNVSVEVTNNTFTMPAGDVTVSVTFSAIEYKITWVLNDGTNSADNTATSYTVATDTITLANPTKTGYTFAGWNDGTGVVTSIDQGSTGDITLTATWTANTYTIAYNENGGSGDPMDSTSATYDVAATLTTNAYSKTGYTFAGWATELTGEVEYADKATVSNLTATSGEEVTLYAVWTIVSYDITKADTTNGSFTVSGTQNYGQTITITPSASDGYEVKSITVTDSQSGSVTVANNEFTMPADDVTVTVTFSAITYTITYAGVDGATNSNTTTSYTIESSEIVLSNPTKDNYTFVAWEDGEGNVVESIDQGSTGNITLTATWTANLKEIEVTAQPTDAEYAFGETFDGTGMVVKATYWDDETDDDFTAYTVDDTALYVSQTSITITATADSSITTTVTISVSSATLTSVTTTQTATTYDGTAQAITAITATSVDGSDVTVEYSTDGGDTYSETLPSFTDANTYTVYYKITAENHEAEESSVSFVISKADISITVADKNSVFGDTLEDLTYTIDSGSLYSPDSVVLSKADGTAVGTYTISGSVSDNYNASITAGTYTITNEVPTASVLTGETITERDPSGITALDATTTVSDGGTLSYQWYSNTTASVDGGATIANATSATYSPSIETDGTTYYYCVVTNASILGGNYDTTCTTNFAGIVVEEKEPVSIAITTEPSTTYFVGNVLSVGDLVVEVTYDNAETATLTTEEYTLSLALDYALQTTDESVTITLVEDTNITVSFEISVIDMSSGDSSLSEDDISDATDSLIAVEVAEVEALKTGDSATDDAIDAIVGKMEALAGTATTAEQAQEVQTILDTLTEQAEIVSGATALEVSTGDGGESSVDSASKELTIDDGEGGETQVTVVVSSADTISYAIIESSISETAKAEFESAYSSYAVEQEFTIVVSTSDGGDVTVDTGILWGSGKSYVVAHWTVDGVEEIECVKIDNGDGTYNVGFETDEFSPFQVLSKAVSSSNITIDSSYTVGGSSSSSSSSTTTDTEEEVEEEATTTPEVEDEAEEETTAPVVTPTMSPAESTDYSSSNTWIWIVLGVLVVGGIVGFVIYKKKQQ